MEKIKQLFKDVIFIVVISVVFVIPIRVYVAQPFVVSGQSMDQTFTDGQYLIVDEISYRFEEPKRGDVIIFRVPPNVLASSGYKADKKVFYIKRIIGLPGETLEFKNNETFIKSPTSTSTIKLKEDYAYIDRNMVTRNLNTVVTLANDEYFVMGDNRNNSSDSRFWGPLKREYIKGKPFVRLFPFTEISLFPGEINKN